jgi:hypothetical protein
MHVKHATSKNEQGYVKYHERIAHNYQPIMKAQPSTE